MATVAEKPLTAVWPFSFEVLDVRNLFVDATYQRPLTSFKDKIKAAYDPALVGTLVVSARQSGQKAGKFACVDGQTRAASIRELAEDGIVPYDVPCLVYYNLTRADEASLFARLQKERRGIQSFHRFRAALVANEPEAKAISRIVEGAGYLIGVNQPNTISAVAALERVYRQSPELLERVVVVLREAWQERFMPKGDVLRGLGYFLSRNEGVDDDRLARRLSTNTPEMLNRKAMALREGLSGGSYGAEKYMAAAIEATYNSRAKR